jgi:oxygen-dependent protoporphyrinogen oxidase
MPHLALGHLALVERVDAELADHPGLYLTGNSYRGVGLADTIRNAADLARSVGTDLAVRSTSATAVAGWRE